MVNLAELHALERRYDGPFPPETDPCAAARAAAALLHRLAGETRAQTARRRRALTATAAAADPRLATLTLRLAAYRRDGTELRPPSRD